MNLLVCVNDLSHSKAIYDLGLRDIIVASKFSTYRKEFKLNDIKMLNNDFNIFVSFYDLLPQNKIDEVKDYISELIDLGITNFIINDIGLLEMLSSFNVNIILDNITLNTNYSSIKLWQEVSVGSCVLGREITLQEMLEISDEVEVCAQVQGKYPIFTSIRKLVKNYEQAKGVDDLGNFIFLKDKSRSKLYPTIQNDNGVIMFSDFEQCSIEELSLFKNFKYLIIDQVLVENETNVEIVKLYIDKLNGRNVLIDDVQALSTNKQSKGFLYKKTLYKL